MPRKKRTGVRFVPGESATVSRQIDSGKGCRQNGRRAESAIPPPGESATVSRKISSLSPEERERDAGRMAVEPRARLYHGESATVSRQIDSLSPEGRERDAGRMAVEPRARFLPREKCYGFATNQFTGKGCRQNGRRAESAIPPPGESATVSRKISSLSPKKTDVRLPDQYDREHSFVFRVSCCRAGIVYENCWSSRKLLNLHKTL